MESERKIIIVSKSPKIMNEIPENANPELHQPQLSEKAENAPVVAEEQNTSSKKIIKNVDIDEEEEDDEEEQQHQEVEQDEEVLVSFEAGVSQKGGTVLWFDGFRFVNNNKKDGRMYWRCDRFRTLDCPVRAITTEEDPTTGKIMPSPDPAIHNHLPDPVGRKVEARLTDLKRKIFEEPQATPSELVTVMKSSEVDDEVFASLPNDKALQLRILRKRRQMGQPTPRQQKLQARRQLLGLDKKPPPKFRPILKREQKGMTKVMKSSSDCVYYERTPQSSYPHYFQPQRPEPSPPQPRDRFSYFSTFVDSAVRDMNSQSPEIASQLMQTIYATIANYQMQMAQPAPPQPTQVAVPTTSYRPETIHVYEQRH